MGGHKSTVGGAWGPSPKARVYICSEVIPHLPSHDPISQETKEGKRGPGSQSQPTAQMNSAPLPAFQSLTSRALRYRPLPPPHLCTCLSPPWRCLLSFCSLHISRYSIEKLALMAFPSLGMSQSEPASLAPGWEGCQDVSVHSCVNTSCSVSPHRELASPGPGCLPWCPPH